MIKLLDNYVETGAIILFGVGFATMLINSNLIKKIIGMNIMDTAIFLFFIAKGYIPGKEAPLVVGDYKGVEAYINPIPTSLMLTGIVVAVSMTAFLLALTVKINEKYGTIELDEILKGGRDESR
ncbi:Na(+)/H(+) antiporter subunit C1 [Andreesenia angusta]|uniref:Na(+)/H(+) antiporter subunit C1 n=1 Tax=Andreesenia angusta TaxID=39480 RepID=A0A1S1V508_9FIRM|nr:cation:proton antiporter subunit C [Andreesenia angusta]OHW61723.1 Na(+)/H(+) antiporter subunit C1 [Andreesenia angusta]